MTLLRAGAEVDRLRAAGGLRRPGPARTSTAFLGRRARRRATGSRCATSTRASTRPGLDRIVLDLPEPWQVVKHAERRAATRRDPRRLHADRSCRSPSSARRSTTAVRLAETHRGAAPRLARRGPGGAARPPDGGPHRLPHRRPAARRPDGGTPRVNLLDLLIIVARPSARGVGGYRLGFVARAASWVGHGRRHRCVAARLPARRARAVRRRPATPSLLLVAAGRARRRRVPRPGASGWSSAAGSTRARREGRRPPGRPRRRRGRRASSASLVAVWLLAPAMADVPGWPARQARTSAIARRVDDVAARRARHARRRCGASSGDAASRRCSTRCARAPTSARRRPESGLEPEVPTSGSPLDGEGRGRGLRPHPGRQRRSWSAPTWSSPTPTWWRARTTTAVERHPTAQPCRPTVVAFDPDRDLARAARCPASSRPPLPDRRRRRSATGGARVRPPRRRAAASSRRSEVGQRGAGDGPRHLRRATAPSATCSFLAAGAAAGRLRRGPRRRQAARSSAWPSPSPPTARTSPTPSTTDRARAPSWPTAPATRRRRPLRRLTAVDRRAESDEAPGAPRRSQTSVARVTRPR